MQIDFANKRVLITGGTRGIGLGTVSAFLEAGACVAVNGRTSESVAEAISGLGHQDMLVAAPGDVSTAAGCSSIVNLANNGLGGLDILVNSAGIATYEAMEEVDEAGWDRMLDINLKGTFFCIQAALPALRNNNGNIVNIASDAGLIGVPKLSVYCASKAGVINMTRALALEFAPDVRVNCVCPGYVDTDMVRRDGIDQADDPSEYEQSLINETPLRRIASPKEIGDAILYLASDEARFVTGAAFQIDGGTTAGY